MATIYDDNSGNLIFGTGGDDVIFGNGGNDTIRGGGGNDRIYGGAGVDSLFGSLGDDTFVFRGSQDTDLRETIDGGAGFDTLLLSSYGSTPGSGTIQINFRSTFLSSIERLQFASWWNDIDVSFELTPDTPTNFSSSLEFIGGAGKDSVIFTLREWASLDLRGATFTNWSASDRLVIQAYDNECTVYGTGFADDIEMGGSLSLFKGNDGDDLFHLVMPGIQTTIDGGAGYDRIVLDDSGYLQDNWITGIEEIVFARSSPPDFDYFSTDFYSEYFDIGAANPFFHFVDADAYMNAVAIFMTGSDTHFSAAGFTFENWGAANVVQITGTQNNNRIIGSIVGDQIWGFDGADTLTGGAGNDTFGFSDGDSGVGTAARDKITDFTAGDKIDLSFVDANSSLVGDQAFVLDTDGILAEGEIQFIGALNTLIRINLDADPEADMEIFLRGVTPGSLTMNDFIL